jgi:hypothetical protein
VRLLAGVDGRLLVWTRGEQPVSILGEGITDAAWVSPG